MAAKKTAKRRAKQEPATKWPLGKIVEVEWDDAHSVGGWGTTEEYLLHTTAPCKTIGYLLREDKEAVVLIQTQQLQDGLTGAMALPKGWIKSMKVVR